MNIFKKRKLVPTEHDLIQDANHTEIQEGLTVLKADITDEVNARTAADVALESKIDVNTASLFINDTDDTAINGEWNTDYSYGDVSTSGSGVVTLTSTASSDAGIHNTTPFDILRNNVQITIKCLDDRGQMVILSLSDIPFKENLNRSSHWPLPNYGKGILIPIQHSSPTNTYKWIRSSEVPGTTITSTSVRTVLFKDEALYIGITDGVLTFNILSSDGATLTKIVFPQTITLPLTKYYIGLHKQSSSADTQSYKLRYSETTRNAPYSIISELSSELLKPTSTRYVVDPHVNNVDYPNFYCDKYVRHVITDPSASYNLVLPTPDNYEDFVFTIKNTANVSISVVLPAGYKWGNTYSTANYTLSNHKTVDILYNPRGLLGDWVTQTASKPISLCHILHETTTINNP